jgi:glutamyl-tRNA synthetase
MNSKVRVRFAPSPTGALHIGGVRTALYNYLFAKNHGGVFILRIEDTDQNRYVPGAEAYILEALAWLGINPEEGPQQSGDYGPYRQSERKAIYAQYALQLVEAGRAYYAFDTPEQLEDLRERLKAAGESNIMYNAASRMSMSNSLTLPADQVMDMIQTGAPYVIRLKVPENETVELQDIIRGEVVFNTAELDDKVLLKGDGMPTYHLANVVDDHLMEISHVIRGEEWLPSTAHHLLLHRYLGWEDQMPHFAHLPLILKPDGKGKLSKRDGAKLGMPVFPLSWNDPNPEECFDGFREKGFDPEALLNFLAFLGWNPGTEKEIYSMEELCKDFSLERVSKSGARFDFEKIKWFNQQYIKQKSGAEIAVLLEPELSDEIKAKGNTYLAEVCELMKERVHTYYEILTEGYYLFRKPDSYDTAVLTKKWKADSEEHLEKLMIQLRNLATYDRDNIEQTVKSYAADSGLGAGGLFPLLRLAVSGTLQGPDLFSMMALMGADEINNRIFHLAKFQKS